MPKIMSGPMDYISRFSFPGRWAGGQAGGRAGGWLVRMGGSGGLPARSLNPQGLASGVPTTLALDFLSF